MIQPKCYRCGTELPDGNQFCGKCGTKLIPDTIDSLVSRLFILEASLKEQQDKSASDQKLVELETVDRIEKRAWQKLRNWFLPVPITVWIFLLGLAVITGKGILDLRDGAAEARRSLDRTISNFRSDQTKIDSMHETLSQLEKSLQTKQSEVQQLRNKFEAVRGESGLWLRQRFKSIVRRAEKESAPLVSLGGAVWAALEAYMLNYPKLSKPVVWASTAVNSRWTTLPRLISCQRKESNDIFVVMMLNEQSVIAGFLKMNKVGKATDALLDKGFTIFLGPVWTASYRLSEDSCQGVAKIGGPPCVFYFEEKFPVAKLMPILQTVQPITPDRLKYVSPQSLPETGRQLIEQSCLDAVVVLGK